MSLELLKGFIASLDRTFLVGGNKPINDDFKRKLILQDVLACLKHGNMNDYKKLVKETVDNLSDRDVAIVIMKFSKKDNK